MGTIDREALLFKRLTVIDFTEHTNTQIQQLFKELNDSISQKQALAIAQTPENVLVVCQYQNQIVGMATMATYKVISGHKGMIEDVVVSQHFRGYGIGKQLMQLLLAEAHTLNLNEILLFSGHHRKAAIGLYTSLGFVLKNSGLYRLPLT